MISIIGQVYAASSIGDATTLLPGWYVNSTKEIVAIDDFKVVALAPIPVFIGVETYCYKFESEQQAKQLLNWNDETGFQPVFKAVKNVPLSVTRRQARQQLLLMGLLDQVEPTIAAIPDETARRTAEIYWQDATDFERDSAFLLSIAEALGLNADALDDAFIAAAQL